MKQTVIPSLGAARTYGRDVVTPGPARLLLSALDPGELPLRIDVVDDRNVTPAGDKREQRQPAVPLPVSEAVMTGRAASPGPALAHSRWSWRSSLCGRRGLRDRNAAAPPEPRGSPALWFRRALAVACADVFKPWLAVMTGRPSASSGQSAPSLARRMLDFLLGRKQPPADAPTVDQPSDLYRTAVHESGHCIVARLLGVPVQFATTIPDVELGFGGRAMIGFGSPANRTVGDNYLEVDEIARTVDQHMPRDGESRSYAAEWYVAVHDNAIQFLAGGAAEAVVFGCANERTSRSDYSKAR
jgi:hypothetical protein